jgi:YVTN family beta-propeller protein
MRNFIVNMFRAVFFLLIMVIHGTSIQLTHIKTFKGARAPKAVEISPGGDFAAVMNLEGLDFWLIDTKTLNFIEKVKFHATPAKGWDYKRQKPIKSYAQKPVECAFSENGRYVWVSLHNASAVAVYDREKKYIPPQGKPVEKVTIKSYPDEATQKMKIPHIATGKTPKIIKITPDGKYAIIANWHSSSVTVVDAKTYKKVKTIRLGGKGGWVIPRGIAVSPDSSTAYIGNMGGGSLSILDLDELKILKEVRISRNPRHLVINENGTLLYISDNKGGEVYAYDIVAEKIIKRVKIGKKVRTAVLSPNEKYIFAAVHDDSKVVVVDAETMQQLSEIAFPFPMGMAITPDGKQLWVTSYRAGLLKVYSLED